jgi:IclR family pca regulon transcriptional regulator
MTVSEIAKATDLTRAGARRFLLTLLNLGYLKSDGKQFSLAPKVMELGLAYLSSQSWLALATPAFEQLREQLDEAISATVLEAGEVIYVARFPVNRVMTMSMDIGSRKPAFCTAMGRVLLGEMPESQARAILAQAPLTAFTDRTLTDPDLIMNEVKKAHLQGYALVDRELETNLTAISVPLRNYRGEVIAAVNVCGHPSTLSVKVLEQKCLPALSDTCHRISRLLV